METHRRESDGRRRFTPEFKREQVARVQRGELTMAELSRELAVSHSLVRKCKILLESGGTTAVGANEEVVLASEPRAAQQRIRELERARPEDDGGRDHRGGVRRGKKRPSFYGVSKR